MKGLLVTLLIFLVAPSGQESKKSVLVPKPDTLSIIRYEYQPDTLIYKDDISLIKPLKTEKVKLIRLNSKAEEIEKKAEELEQFLENPKEARKLKREMRKEKRIKEREERRKNKS